MADGSQGAEGQHSRAEGMAERGLRMTWSRSKANLLRSIWRANRMNRIMRINDFNRRDIGYFQARGLIELGERGPVLTDKGITKLEGVPAIVAARQRVAAHAEG